MDCFSSELHRVTPCNAIFRDLIGLSFTNLVYFEVSPKFSLENKNPWRKPLNVFFTDSHSLLWAHFGWLHFRWLILSNLSAVLGPADLCLRWSGWTFTSKASNVNWQLKLLASKKVEISSPSRSLVLRGKTLKIHQITAVWSLTRVIALLYIFYMEWFRLLSFSYFVSKW